MARSGRRHPVRDNRAGSMSRRGRRTLSLYWRIDDRPRMKRMKLMREPTVKGWPAPLTGRPSSRRSSPAGFDEHRGDSRPDGPGADASFHSLGDDGSD